MTTIERSVVIEAAVDEVFAYASDWRRWHEWFQGTSGFEPSGPVERGDGARYTYTAHLLGLPAKVETEVHDFVEGSGWRGIGTRGLSHTTWWRFEPVGDRTRFTYRLEYRLPVPMIGPAVDALLIRPAWRRIIDRSLSELRDRLSGRGRGSAS